MAGYNGHPQIVHVLLKAFIPHSEKHTIGTFKTFDLFVTKFCNFLQGSFRVFSHIIAKRI